MRRFLVAATALLALLVVSQPAAAQKRGDRNVITKLDLDEGGASVVNALDAVQRMRPNWLRPSLGRQATAGMIDASGTSSTNATEPIIYVDERRQPTLDILRTIPVLRIKEIKYMDQNKAVQMLGPGHEAGAILVSTTDSRG